MAKYSLRFPIEKDQKIMNNLVKYVMGKPFPDRHTVMEDVDERYGMRGFTPSEIFESAKGPRELYFITFQDLKKAKRFTRKVGTWWPEKRVKPIYDADKRHMGNIKISWYYYTGDKEPNNDGDYSDVNFTKSSSVPVALRKVFTEELTDDGGRDHKLLVVGHAVLVESGSVLIDLFTFTELSRSQFLKYWLLGASQMRLVHTLPEVLDLVL
ncbi:hypothetical protein T459_03319 [Capsicum annuum]|uniref:NAC domain-containing protein n=1 Tax=Capsicum annuum TaxID=4072 RepID=A0A2G3AMG8_CAPAN|nr:hypothetical protein T459_03319 [Capsicum annuum]